MRWEKVAALGALAVYSAERAMSSGSMAWGCLWAWVGAVAVYATWRAFRS